MGGSNSNTSDHKIVVGDLGELAQVWVAPLDEGTEATVLSLNSARYVLHKNSGLAVFLPDVVSPGPGAPIAGAANARWLREIGGGVLQTKSVELASDQNVFTTSTVPVPIPNMNIPLITSPLGGILLVDFSGVIVLTGPLLGQGVPEVTVDLVLDGVPVAHATFNGQTAQDELTPFASDHNAAFFETVAITKRIPVGSGALVDGPHSLSLNWSVKPNSNTTAACNILSDPNIFFMALRVMEVSV